MSVQPRVLNYARTQTRFPWRRPAMLIAVYGAIGLGIGIALTLPKRYAAQAIIELQPYIRSLDDAKSVREQFDREIQRNLAGLKSLGNLQKAAKKVRESAKLDVSPAMIGWNLSVQRRPGTNVIFVRYTSQDPALASAVVMAVHEGFPLPVEEVPEHPSYEVGRGFWLIDDGSIAVRDEPQCGWYMAGGCLVGCLCGLAVLRRRATMAA